MAKQAEIRVVATVGSATSPRAGNRGKFIEDAVRVGLEHAIQSGVSVYDADALHAARRASRDQAILVWDEREAARKKAEADEAARKAEAK